MPMDAPASMYTKPGPDTTGFPLPTLVDMILSQIGADRAVDQTEAMEIQRLMVGLQAVGQQRMMAQQAAQQQMAGPSDETSDYGSDTGAEPTEEPETGAEFGGM